MARNNRHQPQEEEESIFISMTDIMVGLLFIFILIIMFFALQAKLDAERIESIQIEKEDLIQEFGKAKSSLLREISLSIGLMKRIKTDLLKKKIITGSEVPILHLNINSFPLMNKLHKGLGLMLIT